MASALAVYVGEKMVANLEIAISTGTWGCPGPQGAQLLIGRPFSFSRSSDGEVG